MSSAAPFPRERQEVFRPGRTSRAADERGAIVRVIDQMKPDEGWLSLPLVFILCGAVGWSIADSRWILGRDELTTFLVWIALAGALWGYTSARVGMSPWVAQFLGCVVGAFVLLLGNDVVPATILDVPAGGSLRESEARGSCIVDREIGRAARRIGDEREAGTNPEVDARWKRWARS